MIGGLNMLMLEQLDNLNSTEILTLKPFPEDYPVFLYSKSPIPKIPNNDLIPYHPVGLSQQGMIYFLHTQNKHNICRKFASAIMQEAIEKDGQILFPYKFKYKVKCIGKVIPPFYSAMAQGEALSFFSLCYNETKDAFYKRTAKKILPSLLRIKDQDTPYLSIIEDNYLFFEEAPWNGKTPKILNGFMFDIIGLINYLTLVDNNDKLAKKLLETSIKTLIDWFTKWRIPNSISRYWLISDNRSLGYHYIHVKQLYLLWLSTKIDKLLYFKNLLETDAKNALSVKGIIEFAKSRFKHHLCI